MNARDNVMQLSEGLTPGARFVTSNGVPEAYVHGRVTRNGPLHHAGAVATVTHEARHRLALQKAQKVRNALNVKQEGSQADVTGYGQRAGANHQDEYDASLRHLDADGLADLLDENTPANRWDQRRKGLDARITRGEPAAKMQQYADQDFDPVDLDREGWAGADYEGRDANFTSPRRNSRSNVMRLTWNQDYLANAEDDDEDEDNWQEFCESEPDDPRCEDRRRMRD
jgi:hypothetical protein